MMIQCCIDIPLNMSLNSTMFYRNLNTPKKNIKYELETFQIILKMQF
jgi:hypothetical protein